MQRTAAFKAASLTARQRQSWEEAFAQVPSLRTHANLPLPSSNSCTTLNRWTDPMPWYHADVPAAALTSYKHCTMLRQSNWTSPCVRLLISKGRTAGQFRHHCILCCLHNQAQAVEDVNGQPLLCKVMLAHQTRLAVMRRVDQRPDLVYQHPTGQA